MNIGDKISDNDPRMYSGNRVLTIIEMDETHVRAKQDIMHPVRIRKNRIYNDGKQRRSGFTLLAKPEATE